MQKVFIIGRQPDPSYLTRNEVPLIINESEETQHVSRTHARLTAESDGSFFIEDLNSTGGTFVNGARISHLTQVHPHSRITLGKQYAFDINHPTISRETSSFFQDQVAQERPQDRESSDIVEYAGWGQRLGAYLLDWIILSVFTALIYLVIGLLGVQDPGAIYLLALIASIIILHFYMIRPLTSQGNTFGKRAAGIRVLSASTMDNPSTGQAWGRTICYAFSGFLFAFGFLMALWTKKKQALHDMMANTVVVKN